MLIRCARQTIEGRFLPGHSVARIERETDFVSGLPDVIPGLL
jgi:hypothetical protein